MHTQIDLSQIGHKHIPYIIYAREIFYKTLSAKKLPTAHLNVKNIQEYLPTS